MTLPPNQYALDIAARDLAFDMDLKASGLLDDSVSSASKLARSVDQIVTGTRFEDSLSSSLDLETCARRFSELEFQWSQWCNYSNKADHKFLCTFFKQREGFRYTLITDLQKGFGPANRLSQGHGQSLFRAVFLPQAMRLLDDHQPFTHLSQVIQQSLQEFHHTYQDFEWDRYSGLFKRLEESNEWNLFLSPQAKLRLKRAKKLPDTPLAQLQRQYLDWVEWKAKDQEIEKGSLAHLCSLFDLLRTAMTRELGVIFSAEQACVHILDAETAWQTELTSRDSYNDPKEFFLEKSRFRCGVALRLLQQVMRLVKGECDWDTLWKKWTVVYDGKVCFLYPRSSALKNIPEGFTLYPTRTCTGSLKESLSYEDLDQVCNTWLSRIRAFLSTEIALHLLPEGFH